MSKRLKHRQWMGSLVLAAGCAVMAPASAFEVDVYGQDIKIDSLVSIGTVIRMQDRDNSLVSKSNLQPGLCVRRTGGGDENGPDPSGNNTYAGDTCSPTRPGANERFIAAPGAFSPNGDNGNLNFDKHDIVHATAKLTTDFSANIADFNLFARALYFYDAQYTSLDERHPDTTLQNRRSEFPDAGKDEVGTDFRFLDYFVSRGFEVAGRNASIKIGNQVLNWGESAFLALNSLNSINPPNQALLRVPGFDIKELFQPVGMAVLNTELFDGINLETFYQYQWKPILVDPVGSFFSSSDTIGPGGEYAMLSFGKAPEDPFQIYEPYRNPDDPTAVLGSRSSRTVLRDHAEEKRREPDGGGQYGAALRLFFDQLNNGTEIGFYAANYHSRVPAASAIAAQRTCIPDSPSAGPVTVSPELQNALNQIGPAAALFAVPNLASLVTACDVPEQNIVTLVQRTGNPNSTATYMPAGSEALPLDTMRLVIEYPEDIHVFGVSFNTTVGDLAWSGEYAYRPNLPVQIHSTDLVFAALQPAFPAQDYNLGAATLPGRRTAVPDFISQYRGIEIGPGDYIRGYERLKVGQLGTTFLRIFGGGDNPIGASQITALLELGMTHVIDFPDKSELQFQGGGVDTHITSGADGSTGVNPRDIRCNTGDATCDPNDPSNNRTTANLRQNPTAQRAKNFGTEYSYGYRFVTFTRFDDALAGVNIELLNALFHDVDGTAPGLGQNFVEGRKQIISGIRFDYLSTWNGEVRYTWFTGGENRDSNRDRDNLMLNVGYQF